jgi:hypothetical protein
MKASSLLVVNSALAILSIAVLLCGLSGPAMSQTATPSGAPTTSLPNVVVEAPKQVARPPKPKPRAVARNIESARTSPTTPSASPTSQTAQLAKLEKIANAAGSCADGCVTSFRTANAPWRGCSVSGGMMSSTCRNVGNYKTYAQCTDAGQVVGWRGPETSWYCSSLALK